MRVNTSSLSRSIVRALWLALASSLVLNGFWAAAAHAYWPVSPFANLDVAPAATDPAAEAVCASGDGGVWVLWSEWSGSSLDLRVQRVDVVGRRQLGDHGRLVFTDIDRVSHIAADGAGGCFVVASGAMPAPGSGSCVRVQHVGVDGALLWGDAGVLADSARYYTWQPGVLADGSGGAFVSWTWSTQFLVAPFPGCLQHLDATGAATWTSGAVTLPWSLGITRRLEPLVAMVRAANGGIFVASPTTYFSGVAAARLSAEGEWGPTFWVSGSSNEVRLFADGENGALVGAARYAYRVTSLQRLDATGVASWPGHGIVPITDSEASVLFAPNGARGAWFVSSDTLTGTMRASEVDSNGVMMPGAAVLPLVGSLVDYGVCSAGLADGIAWCGSAFPTATEMDPVRLVFARVRWSAGVPALVCSTTVAAPPPGSGLRANYMYGLTGLEDGACVAWHTLEPTTGYSPPRMYLTRVDRDGFLGTTEPVIESALDVPGDAGGVVRLHWRPSDLARTPGVNALVYDVLRADERSGPWETIASGLVSAASGDSLDAPTFADSSAVCDCRTWFVVRARAAGGIVRDSPPIAATSFRDDALAVPTEASARIKLEVVSPSSARAHVVVRFALPRSQFVSLVLHDAAGRRVRVLERGWLPAGSYERGFDRRDEAGLRSGLYLVRLTSGAETRTKKLVLID